MPVTAIKGPYIPRADGALREWLDNFARVATRSPSAVGLTAAEVAAIEAAAERYALAYARARAPGTRNRTTVGAKNAARRKAWDVVRPVAMRIKHHAGISDAQKVELGVYPPLRGQSRIRAPRKRPELELVEMGRGHHRLRFRDPARPARLAKPYGAVAMELRVAVAKRAARSPEGARRVKVVTRHVFRVKFKAAESGQTATYFGRWVTRREKTGPWSRGLVVRVA